MVAHDPNCICEDCLQSTRTARVYREGPEWVDGLKWWQQPHLLGLHVASYQCEVSWDDQGDKRIAEFLARNHPGCVFVY